VKNSRLLRWAKSVKFLAVDEHSITCSDKAADVFLSQCTVGFESYQYHLVFDLEICSISDSFKTVKSNSCLLQYEYGSLKSYPLGL